MLESRTFAYNSTFKSNVNRFIGYIFLENYQKQMKKLIGWHKTTLERVQKEMGVSNYVMYWMSFLEGALVMWIIMRLAINS